MGFHLAQRVYNEFTKAMTSTSEQAVLACIALRGDDNTRDCFEDEDSLADMTHFHATRVSKLVQSAARKGLLTIVKKRKEKKITARGRNYNPKWAHNHYYFHFPSDPIKPQVKTEVTCLSGESDLPVGQTIIIDPVLEAEINEAWQTVARSLSLRRLDDELFKKAQKAFVSNMINAVKEPGDAPHLVDVMLKNLTKTKDPVMLARDMIAWISSVSI